MDTRPPAVQFVLIAVPALLLGVVCGLALDLAAAAYYGLLVLAVIGGVGAGLEHDGAGAGAQRGLTGGAVFGAGVLLGHHLLSRHAKVALPHPEGVDVIVSAIFGALFGAIGGAIRGAREHVVREIALDERDRGRTF
jgi:hypothetical protein